MDRQQLSVESVGSVMFYVDLVFYFLGQIVELGVSMLSG